MPDLIENTRRQITERLKELRPHVEEHRRLQDAIDALDRIAHSTAATLATRVHTPGRVRSAGKASASVRTPRRAGRRKGSGGRAAQALEHIKEHPGITVHELAAKMGMKSSNYLYRVLPALEKSRKINKQGKGWHPGRK